MQWNLLHFRQNIPTVDLNVKDTDRLLHHYSQY